MKIPKRVLLTIGLVIFSSAILYVTMLPKIESEKYIANVQSSADSLQKSFHALQKSAELPLLNNPYASSELKNENAKYIGELIQEVDRQLDYLNNSSNALYILPFANILGQYNQAKLLHERSRWFVMQTKDALKNYSLLINYLKAFNESKDTVGSELEKFNQVTDLNTYSGRSDTLRQIADSFRKEIDVLENMTKPKSLESMHAAMIEIINELSIGFELLANAISIPADDPIYASANKIELETAKLDDLLSSTYAKEIEQSRAVKEIQDLNEKLELIQ